MSTKSDLPHCLLIQKYADKILRYSADVPKEEFLQQEEVYDACLLNLINIAETIKSLSKKFQEENPEIPYRKIIGLRNIAAHNQERLEAFRQFATVKNETPLLHATMTKIINKNSFD